MRRLTRESARILVLFLGLTVVLSGGSWSHMKHSRHSRHAPLVPAVDTNAPGSASAFASPGHSGSEAILADHHHRHRHHHHSPHERGENEERGMPDDVLVGAPPGLRSVVLTSEAASDQAHALGVFHYG